MVVLPILVMFYGREHDEVYVGDWNGDGRDTIGMRRTPETEAAADNG